MIKPTGLGEAERVEQAALAADAELSSRNAIMSTTRTGVVNGWNAPAVLLYGCLAEDIVGRAPDVLWSPETQTQETEALQRVLAGGPADRFDADRVRKDGTVARVSLTVAPIVDEAGVITGVTTVSWKAGERQGVPAPAEGGVESERRDSREAQERFEKHVKAQRREVHETQEGYDNKVDAERRDSRDAQDQVEAEIESVRRDAWEVQDRFDARQDGERREALEQNEVLQAQLQQAQRLENLGRFARREVVRPQVLDLDQVIAGMAEMLHRTLGEHIDVTTSSAGGLWPVLADPGQLEQVLMNLAVNGRDAMPSGGNLIIETGNVTMDAAFIAGGSKALPGRNVVEHAFELFFSTKSEGAGTGLGLATVYGIVAQAEGHIQIYSEPGGGTTFSIMLPVTAEAAAELSEVKPYLRSPEGETVPIVELMGTAARVLNGHFHGFNSIQSDPGGAT